MSDAAERWNTQRRLPSATENAKILLSALRTSTRSSPTAGAASTSLEARAFHFTAPVSVSSANTSPSLPTPAESRLPTEIRQRTWPEVASMRATVPLRAAA